MTSKIEITNITTVVSCPVTAFFHQAIQDITDEYGKIIKLNFYNINDLDEELIDDNLFRKDLRTADIVLLDVRPIQRGAEIINEVLSRTNNTVIVLFATSSTLWRLVRIGRFIMKKYAKDTVGYDLDSEECYEEVLKGKKIRNIIKKVGTILRFGALKHGRNWAIIIDYWNYGGQENIKNLLLFITKNYGNYVKIKVKPPIKIPEIGIYHPKVGISTDLKQFISEYHLDDKKQTVGVLFFRNTFFEQSKPIVNKLIQSFEPTTNVIPVFASCDATNPKAFKKFFFKDDRPLINALMKVQCHRFYGPLGEDPKIMLNIIEKLKCPMFISTPTYLRELSKWEQSNTGLMPVEVVVNIMRPELDGCIEPIMIGGIVDSGLSKELNTKIQGLAVIDDRVQRSTSRVKNWLKLQNLSNPQKKIAIILYNYPPGDDNLGNASYLDTFESIEKLLKILKEYGYTVNIPDKKIIDIFLGRNLVNSSYWSPKEKFRGISISSKMYSSWFNTLSREIKTDIRKEWGDLPGNVMVRADELLIPGIILGNIFIGLQPSRGVHENPEKAYHDKALPPHHQYIAFYKWLEDEFKADAVIHVGTHGTLEFLKGKEVGLSKHCFPDILIGNLPNIYIYWVTNTSEATIAKRRSYSVIVNHSTPPFTTSELYEELRELEDLVEEYGEARILNPAKTKLVLTQALEKARELNFEVESMEELHRTLSDIKRSIIPKGLHILGEQYSPDDLIEYVTYVMRYDREVSSLHRILAEAKGLDYDDLLQNPSKSIDNKPYSKILGEIEDEVREIVSKILKNPQDQTICSKIPEPFIGEFMKSTDFISKLLENIECSDEIGGLLRALNGEWVSPNIGGDPIRSPEAFPTGSNMYGFDARLVPSIAAYKRGVEIADKSLQHYLKIHGKYPETVGVVLWGFETMKTRGETIGQILHYLGVRPVRKRGPWITDLELIPLEELKRPRIDVVVTICGIFRDTFPNLIILLDKAFKLVSTLDESSKDNYLKNHTLTILEKLKAANTPKAESLATLRMFGPSSGEYATSVRALIETANWEGEEQLGQAYFDSMQHAYGENLNARISPEILTDLLKKVDMTLQIRDTNEFEITDLDHYYEFFGGLSKAVESIKGDKPEMVISDTTKEIIQIDDVKRFIDRGVRTRVLNPKWIDEMLKHDYHGAQKISDRVEYVLGLAATTNKVDNWVWSDIAARYIFDEEMLKRLRENNPYAVHKIIKRLYEANKRGYWDTTEEELEKLKRASLQVEGWIEETL
ncbi:MAG: magnesium chelatase subunit H [Candidatus Helarchaeota archaeon]